MKIIQSFWTKPFLQSGDLLKDSRLNGGWPLREYNYFSWALSCLQLRKYYNNVELITDELGKCILVDKLKLPYSKVIVDLNKLDNYENGLWALGKIYSYSIQESPFLHVDSDIYIFKQFSSEITSASLVAQNLETKSPDYGTTFDELCNNFNYIPDYFKDLVGQRNIPCSNTGIIGGTDIKYFKTYTQEVFNYIDKNIVAIKENIHGLNTAFVNVVYEQVIFHRLAEIQKQKITYLFPDHDDIPKHLGYFHAAEDNKGYVHALGTYKYYRLVHRMLEITLRTSYPDYYTRIVKLIGESEI